jgi:hypothetical protein
MLLWKIAMSFLVVSTKLKYFSKTISMVYHLNKLLELLLLIIRPRFIIKCLETYLNNIAFIPIR